MKLGSEFNLDLHDLKPVPNSFFRYIADMKYCLFDSGRSALKAVTRILGSGYILMPEYICASVIRCFPPERIIFYRLSEDLRIDESDLLSKINGDTAAVYLMHYFGSMQRGDMLRRLREEKERYGFLIIEDTTHSLFSQKHTVGDYCVASLRKWFAVPGGGVLYTGGAALAGLYDEIPRSADNEKAYAMMLKTLHLNGQLLCEGEYRRIFAACEKRLDEQKEPRRISDYAEFLLGCYDVDGMREQRKRNCNLLQRTLDNLGIMQPCAFGADDCPIALPILVPDRDEFREYLIGHQIYCAVHWPFDGLAHDHRPLAWKLSGEIISLPIDQRYGEEEMRCLSRVIEQYKGRLRL